MILEPSKSAEEIERRLSTIQDPELTELLKSFSREPIPPGDYTSPSAPYWKRRIGFIALAGLLAMSAGYGYNSAAPRSHAGAHARPLRAAAVVPRRSHRKVAVHHSAAPHVAVQHHAAIVPVHPAAPAPDEALIRRVRAQLVHQRALAAQAQAQAARAQHQAKLAMQARQEAQERALQSALAQARAEALAAARAEALAREQAESAQAQQEQELARQNAQDPQIKPGDAPPPATGRISTYPRPGVPLPMPGPIDPNCTPHRGSLFRTVLTNAALYEVQRLIH